MNVVVKLFLSTLALLLLAALTLIIYLVNFGPNSTPNWHVETNAVPSASHPLGGFYKEGDCSAAHGWAVGPAGEGEYYISFCGPGGCFAEGSYRPITAIYNDPKYDVIDENRLVLFSEQGRTEIRRCPSRD